MVNDSIDNLRLDINKPKARVSLSVRKGDTKTRTIHIALTSNGAVYSLENVLMAELLITKPDGKVCDQDMVIKGNELQYTFRTQDTNVEGECVCQIRLMFTDGAYLTSPEFYMYVYTMILDQNTSKSENEYSHTDELLTKANEYYENASTLSADVETAKAAALEASSNASESASEAQTYYLDAKNYAEQAENFKDQAETAKTGAETALASTQAVETNVNNLNAACVQALSDCKAEVTNCQTEVTNCQTEVSNAAAQVALATTQATAAATSATAAATSEANALSYAQDALNSELHAKEYEENLEKKLIVATTSTAGIVKPDGTSISIEADGTIHATGSQAIASTTTLGAVKVDGTTITADADGTLHGSSSVDIATTAKVGTVKPDGTTITVAADGTITADISIATTAKVGTVKPDGTTITVAADGTIKAVQQDADDVSYSNTSSGLTATDVQTAIDEVNTEVGKKLDKDDYKLTDLIDDTTAATTKVYSSNKTDTLLADKLDTDGDAKDVTVTFTSADATTNPAYTAVDLIATGETQASLMNKVSQMAQNQRVIKSQSDTNAIDIDNLEYDVECNLLPNVIVNNVGTLNSDGSVTTSATSQMSVVLGAGTYTVSGCPSGGSTSTYRMIVCNPSGANLAIDYGSGATFTLTSTTVLKIYLSVYNSTSTTFYPMLEKGSVAHTYKSYGESFATNGDVRIERFDSLQNEGMAYPTINGITNYTDSDGVYHKNLGCVDLGTLTWSYNSSGGRFESTTIASLYNKTSSSSAVPNIYCGIYTARAPKATWSSESAYANMSVSINNADSKGLLIVNTSYTDASAFKSAMSGVLLFFELATPQTYNSNSKADCIVGTSDMYNASTSYTVGTMCVYNNALWRCLVACSGQTPSEGTYWAQVSLKSLESNLTDKISVVDSGTIAVSSSHTFTCADYAINMLCINSLGSSNNFGYIVMFGKHPSVSNIVYTKIGDGLSASPTISVNGSVLTITTTSSANCYYQILKLN